MANTSKPKILVLSDYYLPGYKSGGGMRTIVNMVERLHDRFDFYIITRDHDGPLDKESYTNVKIGEWNNISNAQVYYLHKDAITFSKLRELILEVQPDSIYTNSYFATLAIYMLILRKLRRIPKYNVIVAPCGELSDGALSLKPEKKKLFLGISKLSNLYENITWKASNEEERTEIEKVKARGGKIFIAPDLTPKIIFENYDFQNKPKKNIGEAKMIFLSRFSAKKNFKWLLENLNGIKGKLIIDIYGPLEDEDYWQKCAEIIKTLPENIQIEAKGTIPHEQVSETLLKYHFFILPTLGENFGHVFLEALAAGCPLLISDRTPWIDLENKGIGWDISLDKSNQWIDKLNYCISLDGESYSKLSANARNFVCDWLKDTKLEEDTLKILEYSLSKR